jgi:hypothetical protein
MTVICLINHSTSKLFNENWVGTVIDLTLKSGHRFTQIYPNPHPYPHLKAKPRQVDVTTLFLWQEVLRERSSQLTFDRLKKEFAAFISDTHCTHNCSGAGETDLEV